jgi:hypothetical protein
VQQQTENDPPAVIWFFPTASTLLAIRVSAFLGTHVSQFLVRPSAFAELVVASGHRLPPKMAPLRTYPAVDIARGQEGAVPNGYVGPTYTHIINHVQAAQSLTEAVQESSLSVS